MKIKDITLIALFAALTAVGAFIRVPIPYVPFTLQYFFCALGAILLGSKKGAIAQLVYVTIGLTGVPVFTKGGGPQYIFEPTFGYLIGFIVAAYVIGRIIERMKELTAVKIYFTSLFGLAFIYILGLAHFYFIKNVYFGKATSAWFVFYYGFLSTIGGDLVLTIIIAIAGLRVLKALRKSGLVKGEF